MKIIGLSGKARAGKSTVASMLGEHGFVEKPLAYPLKEICLRVFAGKMTAFHLFGEGRDEPIPSLGGLTARRALQTLGTEWGRGCYPDVWIELALAEIRATNADTYRVREKFVISDVRFKNEAAAIRKAGGEVWRIVRPGVGLEGEAAAHVSENELPEFDMLANGSSMRGGKPVAARIARQTKMDCPTAGVYDAFICNVGPLKWLEVSVAFLIDEDVCRKTKALGPA
jgi:hypothetical protein